ncbi:MAG: putative quinol monooxygenase [Povalibacter sp.]
MNITMRKLIATGVACTMFLIPEMNSGAASAAEPPMVRIAEIEIDPQQLEAYKAVLAEEQEASVRLEPGVLMLHSVAIADSPTSIRLLEVYASRAAYEAHVKAPHFVKYKTSTEKMVRSLKLIETKPILLCSKSMAETGAPTRCM